jgi:hypothetical protein
MILLGDLISEALSTIGITHEAVSSWLGRPCGCPERQEILNSLNRWAVMVANGKLRDAGEHLRRIMSG